MMNLQAMLYFIAAALEMSLGLFIIFKNLRAKNNLPLFLLITSTMVWQIGSGVTILSKDPALAALSTKIAFLGIIFIPITTYHLALNVLNIKKTKALSIGYILAVLIVPISWTSLILNGVNKYQWGFFFKAGPMHPLFMVFFIFFMALVFMHLFSSYKKEKDYLEKNRKKYFFAALFMAYIGIIDYIPTYGIDIRPFGSLAVMACVSIFAYAIVRHQLMDIEVIIKKTLVFAGLFGFVFGVIVVVAMLTQELMAKYFVHSRFIALGISAAIIVFLQQPVYNFLIRITNKYLFQKKYDARKVLNAFSNEALTILNLDRLCRVTIDTLVTNLYLSNCAILLLSRDEIGYEVYDSSGIDKKTTYLTKESPLISHLKITQTLVLHNSYDRDLQASDSVKKEMDKIKSQLCMPLIIHKDIVGILSLGPKKSDQPYTAEDVDILSTLSKALSIAISNAKLFAQAAQYEKLATIGTLASGINHEVCNPLNNMSTRMQIFIANLDRGAYKDKTKDEILKEVNDMLKDSITQIHKVASITGKLSSFAKPTKMVLSKPVNVSQSIEGALGVLGHKLQLDKIKIIKNIPSGLPNVVADEDQMQQIFFNLIRNAAQAIEEEGEIIINAKEEAGNVKVEISDTGCGIPEDKLDKIFEPFYTTKADGNGYGLSIVREVIWRNKGEIKIKSKEGAGTTFYLEFPKA